MATPEEIIRAYRSRPEAKQSLSPAELVKAYRNRAKPETTPWYKRAVPAFIEKPLESAVNVREMLAGTVPEQGLPLVGMTGGRAAELEKAAAMREDLQGIQRAAGPPGAFRTGMNIAGQIAEYAGPAGAGVAAGRKALTLLPQALARTRAAQVAAPLVGEAATIGGYEAARTPGTPAERAQAAALAAGGTAAGYGAGAVLQKALSGVRRSPDAQAMLDQGVRLTPGQAAAGKMVPAMEEGLTFVPGWSGGVHQLRGQATSDWGRTILQSIDPRVTEAGHAGVAQLQKLLGKGLDDVTEQMADVKPGVIRLKADRMEDAIQYAVAPFDDATRQQITRGITAEIDNLRRKPSAKAWQAFNSRLRDMVSKYRQGGDIREAEVVEQALNSILDLQPPGVRDRLADLNRRYHELVVVETAMGYKPALQSRGIFEPNDLLAAAKRQGSRRLVATGEATMQDAAGRGLLLTPDLATRRRNFVSQGIPANVALGSAGYAVGGPVGAAAMGAAGVPLSSDFVRRALLGQLPGQGSRAQAIIRELRRAAGPTGAAITTERD